MVTMMEYLPWSFIMQIKIKHQKTRGEGSYKDQIFKAFF